MKSICKYKAFSETGDCLLVDNCICEKNLSENEDADLLITPSRELEVSGCNDCPLRDSTFCGAVPFSDEAILPFTINKYSAYVFVTPDWCPLKKEPITISIKQ